MISGTRLFVALWNSTSEVAVFDIADPNNTLPWMSNGIAGEGGFVYSERTSTEGKDGLVSVVHFLDGRPRTLDPGSHHLAHLLIENPAGPAVARPRLEFAGVLPSGAGEIANGLFVGNSVVTPTLLSRDLTWARAPYLTFARSDVDSPNVWDGVLTDPGGTGSVVLPKLLPAGTLLRGIALFDNSLGNRANPDPSATVRYGKLTTDEMFHGYFDVAPMPAARRPTAQLTLVTALVAALGYWASRRARC